MSEFIWVVVEYESKITEKGRGLIQIPVAKDITLEELNSLINEEASSNTSVFISNTEVMKITDLTTKFEIKSLHPDFDGEPLMDSTITQEKLKEMLDGNSKVD